MENSMCTEAIVDLGNDAQKVFGGLQVKPYYEKGMTFAEYRSSLTPYKVHGELNMQNGILRVGKYAIEPTTRVDTLPSDEYNVINTKNGIVYISKNPFELLGAKFWVTIYFEKMHIKKVELSNADEKYKMNYHTMDSTILEQLRKENNDFLINNLGPSHKENLSGLEYEYPWGKVMTYFDFKSAEAGIVVCYF